MEKRTVEKCGVCNHSDLALLWDLPKLPLTEKYGCYDPLKILYFDQRLLICNDCGHVQLGVQLSPELLYTASEYSFRTSLSKSACLGSEFFLNFFSSIKGSQTFNSLLDVGGNDLYLAKKVDIEKRCVVDPVCSLQDGQIIDGVKILGQFIEKVDFGKEELLPDLIFCRHVLEHVANPREMLTALLEKGAPHALYVFEIPCLENLIEANRFDAIFHQHYHYFDLSSFQRLIAEIGGEYVSHEYNRQGSCGGAMLIAFRKGKTTVTPSVDVAEKKASIEKAIQNYTKQMDLLSIQLKKFENNIYGYGASLMLATLGYHLKTDFSELICILDDDEQKDQISYQNVPVTVRCVKKCSIPKNSNFLVTSLENTRSIFGKISEMAPRRVLIPLVN
ncbi:MAG: hypothetical protein COT85_07065 [Chlamydiae bacterium CG10_big_fil_rev_8_21_14_0_10_42_34]|nr:MAG: hypothetical protein COT85_07065 [Chlamydiae bacterium CG10_big_fil_rev_8_21_14_0_10_42_34]